MASLRSLVEGVLDHLYGHSAQLDNVAALTADMSSSDTSLTVDDASGMSAGLVEIDMELMRVRSVDLASNKIDLHPSGRGIRGSLAAAHKAGAEVRIQPIMPYASVVREVNAELQALYPRIVAVDTVDIESTGVATAYELPPDASMVLDVRWLDHDNEWQRIRKWELEADSSTRVLRVDAPSGTVRVLTGRRYRPLSSLDDSLSAAGAPDAVEDIIRMGAVLRLLPSMDIARLSVITAQAVNAGGGSPQPGAGIMVAREIKQQYLARIEQETASFRQLFPARCHITR